MQQPNFQCDLKKSSIDFVRTTGLQRRKGKEKTSIRRIIRDCIQLSKSSRHFVPSLTNSQRKRTCFWCLESIFRHGKRRLYGIDSICTRPGGGGHLLAEWGTFKISQSLNFEHVFQGFLRQFEAGKKSWTVSRCVQQQHGEKSFLIEQRVVKRRRFESKSSFFLAKSFRKELLIGNCYVTKKYVRSKKTENEEVPSERIFTFMPVVLKKRLFLSFQKFKFLYFIF